MAQINAETEFKGTQWASIRQISERLGLPRSTVRNTIHGAVKMVKTGTGKNSARVKYDLDAAIALFAGRLTIVK